MTKLTLLRIGLKLILSWLLTRVKAAKKNTDQRPG